LPQTIPISAVSSLGLAELWSVGAVARPVPLPQLFGDNQGIDLALLPPLSLIAGGVVFAVVDGTKRNSEFVAYLK
jgi:hypothetical protein